MIYESGSEQYSGSHLHNVGGFTIKNYSWNGFWNEKNVFVSSVSHVKKIKWTGDEMCYCLKNITVTSQGL